MTIVINQWETKAVSKLIETRIAQIDLAVKAVGGNTGPGRESRRCLLEEKTDLERVGFALATGAE